MRIVLFHSSYSGIMEKTDLTPIVQLFHDFFTTIHRRRIDELLLVYPSRKSLVVDYQELERFDPDIADRLIKEPDNIIEAAETAIKEMNLALPSGERVFAPHVRFINLPCQELMIEQLGSKNINEFVAFKGVVTKRAEIMHRVKIAFYRCQVCDSVTRQPVVKNFTPPKRCESCKKLALKQVDEESEFVDIQRAEVQELLERVKGGAPTARIELLFEDDQVNTITPGENIELAGTLRLRQPQKFRQKQELVYGRYLEVNSVKSLKKDFEEIDISKEDEGRIKELSMDPNIEKVMVDSVAPGIYGHEEVKWAIALQLFGGTMGKTMKGGAPIRDDIHVLLIGDPGLAKCVTGDSKIVLSDGTITKIKKVVEEALEKDKKQDPGGYYAFSNHDVLSLGLDAKVEEKKANVFWKLRSPEHLYEIETYTGKRLAVTPEHPLFILEDGFIKSKKAIDVKKGEFIASPHCLPIKGSLQKIEMPEHGRTNANTVKLPRYINENFARFLGYLTGDGYVRKTSSYEISLTNSDQELLDDFTNIVESFSLSLCRRDKIGSSNLTVFSVDLGKLLEKMGMVKNSFNKMVPCEILKSPNNIVREFLKAYFDCEAHVSKNGIAVVSASKDLLEEVGIMLLRFGIVSQLHATWSRATNAKNHPKTKYWRLIMCGENAKRYAAEIGFTARVKIKATQKIPNFSNTNIDIVPNLKKVLKETRAGLGLSQFACGIPRTTYQHYERGDRNPSYHKLKKIVDIFTSKYSEKIMKDENLLKKIIVLKKISEGEVFWDRIESVVKVKTSEEWVYDLQVDNVHNFVANSLFVHNSRFLQNSADIAPKSIYVSGKTVSGVGLTVSAEKDELGDGGWTLKAGALVLASGGMAMIDEFDKIDDEDRAALHEAMESSQISVAKAGIVATFRTKTSILAAANPKWGRFDQNKNLADQFKISPSLLSRFDLIFPIVDVLDEEKDSRLAQHILSTHMGKETESSKVERWIDRGILRKYIAYARRTVRPKLSQEASEKIKEFYVDLRRKGKDSGSVAITPRYLEGLVRLAEANAKMRLSKDVEEKDADTAIKLLRYVMRQVMTDRATGSLDVDTIATGKPKSEREKLQKVDTIMEIIREHLKSKDSADIEEIVSVAASNDIDEHTARKLIAELLRKGDIYEKEHGHVRIVGER